MNSDSSIDQEVKKLIEHFRLSPHPEGGYFREIYRSREEIPADVLTEKYSGVRSAGTAIYYLLNGNDFSAFHRIKSDELWFLLQGSDLLIHTLENGSAQKSILNKAEPARLIPAGKWFAAELQDKNTYALVSCVVVPGFDFKDFEMGSTEKLISLFPEAQKLIRRLTIT